MSYLEGVIIGPIRLFAYEAGPIIFLVLCQITGRLPDNSLIFPFWRFTMLTNKPALSFPWVRLMRLSEGDDDADAAAADEDVSDFRLFALPRPLALSLLSALTCKAARCCI